MVVKYKLVTDIQKERGSPPVTRPTHRGSGIALVVERATPKPTPYVYIRRHVAKSYRMYAYNIPMNVIVALFLTTIWNCQIPMRQAQSADNAFPIYRFPPSFAPLSSGASAWEQLQI